MGRFVRVAVILSAVGALVASGGPAHAAATTHRQVRGIQAVGSVTHSDGCVQWTFFVIASDGFVQDADPATSSGWTRQNIVQGNYADTCSHESAFLFARAVDASPADFQSGGNLGWARLHGDYVVMFRAGCFRGSCGVGVPPTPLVLSADVEWTSTGSVLSDTRTVVHTESNGVVTNTVIDATVVRATPRAAFAINGVSIGADVGTFGQLLDSGQVTNEITR